MLVRAGKLNPNELEELEAKEPGFPGVYFGEGMQTVVGRDAEEIDE